MDFKELDSRINLNKSGKLDKIAYCSNFSSKHHDSKLMKDILRQIAINLNYLIARYEQMDMDDVILELRKNCIRAFTKGLTNFNSNTTDAILHIQKNKRPEAKAKLIYISNQLWIYINSSNRS